MRLNCKVLRPDLPRRENTSNAIPLLSVSTQPIQISIFESHLFCHQQMYREYVYSAVVYQKYLTRLRELIIFEPWRENYHFSQPS